MIRTVKPIDCHLTGSVAENRISKKAADDLRVGVDHSCDMSYTGKRKNNPTTNADDSVSRLRLIEIAVCPLPNSRVDKAVGVISLTIKTEET
ncbi:MAG: hypothetical protein AAGH38_03415 [Pseudomonadota bacterium]